MNKHHNCSKEKERFKNKIKFLDNPERRRDFSPDKLLKMLPIKKTNNILDLGAGTGYLTIPAAHMTDGLVYALDLDPNMLELINSKAQDDNIKNIELIKGSIDYIPLADNSIDIVLASLVLHEIKTLANTSQNINNVLKEGGYFLCLEYEKKESSIDGPPMHIRISSSIMEQDLKNVGFTISQKTFLREDVYVIIAQKQSERFPGCRILS